MDMAGGQMGRVRGRHSSLLTVCVALVAVLPRGAVGELAAVFSTRDLSAVEHHDVYRVVVAGAQERDDDDAAAYTQLPTVMRTSNGDAYTCRVGPAAVQEDSDIEHTLVGQMSRKLKGVAALRYLLLVVNDLEFPVQAFWVDWEGIEHSYAIIAPGDWEDFLTFEHHVWAFRYAPTNPFQCGLLVAMWPGEAVSVPLHALRMTEFRRPVRKVVCEGQAL